jgi:hypothetical protein
MNIKPHFIIICREAFLQAGNNNLNLIGIFTQINANKLPLTYPHFAVVVNFDIDTAGDHMLRTVILDPSGAQIAHTELPVRTNAGNWQVIANFEQLRFSTPGAYTFKLTLDDAALGERVLEVKPIVSRTHQKTAIA